MGLAERQNGLFFSLLEKSLFLISLTKLANVAVVLKKSLFLSFFPFSITIQQVEINSNLANMLNPFTINVNK